MENLKITASLQGPVMFNGYMTLDGLLASVIFGNTGCLQRAHNEVPIEQIGGVYMASAMFVTPMESQERALVANLRPDPVWLDPNLIKKKSGSNDPHRAFDRYASLSSNRQCSSLSATWYVRGKPDAIESLLKQIPLLGKKRTCAVEWDLEEGDLDGWTGREGEPLRPIPIGLWSGSRDHRVADVAARPAYWDPANRELCFVGRSIG